MHHTETSQSDTAQAALLLALTSAAIVAVIIAALFALSVGVHWLHRAF